jgi:4-hydroxybenzoate polyprenyltransferase
MFQLGTFNLQLATHMIRDITRAVRTRQWAKNGLLFAGFLFAGHLRQPGAQVAAELGRVLLAFVCFCLLSGAAYVINDWHDVERDRLHPLKKHRPMAAGRISPRGALALIGFCLIGAILCAAAVVLLEAQARYFPLVALAYFVLTLSYSFALKNEAIVDVLAVAAGFVLRIVAGCAAIPVEVSRWILFCTFTLALFVALCKRRAELLEMGDASESTRRVLSHYTVSLLDTFIAIAAGLTITAYSLYTFLASESRAVTGDRHALMMTTVPFVVYGIFRFLLLAHSSPVGGEPEQMLRDKPLMLNVLLWAFWVAVLTLL